MKSLPQADTFARVDLKSEFSTHRPAAKGCRASTVRWPDISLATRSHKWSSPPTKSLDFIVAIALRVSLRVASDPKQVDLLATV